MVRLTLVAGIGLMAAVCGAGEPVYRDARAPVEARVEDLLRRMSVEEKAAQMTMRSTRRMVSGTPVEEVLGGQCYGLVEGLFGGEASKMPAVFNAAQRHCMEKTRLGIPMIPFIETLHGVMFYGATIYPQSVAMASTWDPELVERVASEIADEASALGVRQALAPTVDVIREQRWGRVEEAYGEDPYLVSRLSVAYIRGLQGSPEQSRVGIDARHIGAMAKVFLGHGFPERGINLGPILLPEMEMRRMCLPPFEAAIREANVYSVMPGYNEVNGVPLHGSRALLDGVLRQQLGFGGYTFSDYGGVVMMTAFHRMARDRAAAAKLAVEAGVDVEAPSDACYRFLPELVRTGKLPDVALDQAVRRVLTAKFRLGLFEHPYVDEAAYKTRVHTAVHVATARRVAEEGVVLLKNQGGVLPLDEAKLRSIAVIGPNADQVQFGDYSASKDNRDGVTIRRGIEALVGGKVKVNYAKGCDLLGQNRAGFRAAVETARASDVTVVVVGETSMPLQGVGWLVEPADYRHATSGEGYDRTNLDLTGVQEELIGAVAAVGKPVVVVLVNGRPQTIPRVAASVAAIVEAWYPGEQGGHAVAGVLFGRVNPSGRLPITFPTTVGQLPVYYNRKPSADGYYRKPGSPETPGRDYVDASPAPLWAFGHGLSYTSFGYSGLRLSTARLRPEQTLEVRCRVKNTGARAGREVVQVYVRTNSEVVTMPVMELKKFTKVELQPGEERELRWELGPKELEHLDQGFRRLVEECGYEVMVGASSGDIRLRAGFSVGR